MNKNSNEELGKFAKYYKEAAPLLGLGLQLAVTVVVFVFVGRWLDNKFEKTPLFTIVMASLGIFAALYSFIKKALNTEKSDKNSKS